MKHKTKDTNWQKNPYGSLKQFLRSRETVIVPPTKTYNVGRNKQKREKLAHDKWFRKEVRDTLNKYKRGEIQLHSSEEVWNRVLNRIKNKS